MSAWRQLDRKRGASLTERTALALVKVDLVALAGDDNVPRVNAPRRAHEDSKDVVGNEDGAAVLGGELLDDGVVRGGRVVPDAVNDLERLLVLGVDLVESPLVLGQEAVFGAAKLTESAGLRAGGGRGEGARSHGLDLIDVDLEAELGETRELDLFERDPVAADVDRRFAGPLLLVPPAAATALEPTATALVATASALLLLVAHSHRSARAHLVRASLSEELAVRATSTKLTAATHLTGAAALALEPAAGLTGRLLGAGGTRDDRERSLVLVVVVGKGAGSRGAERLFRFAVVLALLLSRGGGTGGSLCVPVDDAAELVVLGEGGVRDVLVLRREVRRRGAKAALVVVDHRRDQRSERRHRS